MASANLSVIKRVILKSLNEDDRLLEGSIAPPDESDGGDGDPDSVAAVSSSPPTAAGSCPGGADDSLSGDTGLGSPPSSDEVWLSGVVGFDGVALESSMTRASGESRESAVP